MSKSMSSKGMLEAPFVCNDVHLELEDDVIHVVIPPLSFKVVMKKLRMTKLKDLIWRKTFLRMNC